MKRNKTIIWLTVLSLLTVLSGCAQKQEASTENTEIDTTQNSIATVAEAQVENDWSVEMISTTCDGVTARVLFRVTAPTDVNLEEANRNYRFPEVIDCIIPGNHGGMVMQGRNMFDTSIGYYSEEHNLIWSYGAGWEQDNDSLPNTLNWFVNIVCDKIDPNKPQTLDNLFSTTTFYILFDNFVHAWYDEEVQKEIDEKYAGQEYMIDGETLEGLYKTEILVEQEWNFSVNFNVENVN